jgi:hypothetical protein
MFVLRITDARSEIGGKVLRTSAFGADPRLRRTGLTAEAPPAQSALGHDDETGDYCHHHDRHALSHGTDRTARHGASRNGRPGEPSEWTYAYFQATVPVPTSCSKQLRRTRIASPRPAMRSLRTWRGPLPRSRVTVTS